jgi:DNA modification methylase
MKTKQLEITYRPTSELIPYARNSRTHSEDQVAQIAASIQEFGFTNPVLIDEKGIIAGHGRIMGARKLGMDEVPTITLHGLSESQRKAYIIADNKLALNAGWDDEMLRLEIADLKEDGFDLDLLGFEDEELSALEVEVVEGQTDPDDVPEPPEDPVTVQGDIWTLGNHRLMCGDSTSIDAVEKLMAGQKADMVFTDPPYGMKLNADYSSAKSSLKMIKDKGLTGGRKYDNVIGDHEDFTPDLIQIVFAAFPYCSEVFLWGADYYSDLIPDKNDGSWVVWDKRLDDSADKMYGSCFELCWSKARHKREIARIKWAGVFGTEKEFDKKRHHPTQKPSALVEWFFKQWGESEDIVADLYGGSGSTLIACEKTGRKARLMELAPNYCDVIIKRWQDFTGKKAVHESGKTFDEMAKARGK